MITLLLNLLRLLPFLFSPSASPLLCENSGAVATEAGWSTTGGHETSTWDGVAIPVPGQA